MCKLTFDISKYIRQCEDTTRLFIQHVSLCSCVHNYICACVDKCVFAINIEGSFHDNIFRPLIVSAKGDMIIRLDNQPKISRTRTLNVRHAFLNDVRRLTGFEVSCSSLRSFSLNVMLRIATSTRTLLQCTLHDFILIQLSGCVSGLLVKFSCLALEIYQTISRAYFTCLSTFVHDVVVFTVNHILTNVSVNRCYAIWTFCSLGDATLCSVTAGQRLDIMKMSRMIHWKSIIVQPDCITIGYASKL